MANIRNELMTKLDELTDGDEDVLDAVKDFVDDIECKFQDISTLLGGITIDNVGNITDAQELAVDTATALY